MIWSVSTSERSSGTPGPRRRERASRGDLVGRSRSRPMIAVAAATAGRDEVGPAAAALAALEVPVRRRRAALSRRQDVGVHAEAHRAARLAPLEAGREEDLVEPLVFGLFLHAARAGHDERAHALVDACAPRATAAAARRSSIRELVHEPMKTTSTGIERSGVPGSEVHVVERALGWTLARRRRRVIGRGHDPVEGDDLGRVRAPGDEGRRASSASSVISRSKTASSSETKVRQRRAASSNASPPWARPGVRAGSRSSSRRPRRVRRGRPPRCSCCTRSSGPPSRGCEWPRRGTRSRSRRRRPCRGGRRWRARCPSRVTPAGGVPSTTTDMVFAFC